VTRRELTMNAVAECYSFLDVSDLLAVILVSKKRHPRGRTGISSGIKYKKNKYFGSHWLTSFHHYCCYSNVTVLLLKVTVLQ
jgi:hypothetical protein